MKTKLPLLLAVFFCWLPASADIQDGLDAMFMSTGNEPAVYSSQRRFGVDLGTLRLRAPISSYQLVNLSRPTLRAGCGGIDMYGGSFTFINAEQFRQILRQIGANALGYAFKLALASMCKECDSILSDLQDMINATNAMQVDTCKWAKGFVNDLAEAVPEKYRQNWQLEETTAGNFTDTFGAVQEVFDNWGNAESGGDASGADPARKDVGNYTWNALVRRGGPSAGSVFSFLDGNVNNDELLMNLAGTFIYGVTATDELNGEVTSRLTYQELKFGKNKADDDATDTNPLLICEGSRDSGSNCMDPTPVASWSFEGVQGWAEDQLQLAANHMANEVTAGQPHSAALQDFLGSLPFHTMRHMMELQGEPAKLNLYVQGVKEYVAAIYASSLALVMVERIEHAYSDIQSPKKFDFITNALKEFRRQAEADRDTVQKKYMNKIMEVEDLVKSLDAMTSDEARLVYEKG